VQQEKKLLPTFSTNYTYTYFPQPPVIKFTKEDLQDVEMSGEDVSVPLPQETHMSGQVI